MLSSRTWVPQSAVPSAQKRLSTLEDAAVRVQEICDAAQSINPDVICLAHGGPISKAPEAAFINEKTDTVGFVGASSIERFACEESIPRVTASFKE